MGIRRTSRCPLVGQQLSSRHDGSPTREFLSLVGRKVGFREASLEKERVLDESGLWLKQGTAEAQLRDRRPLMCVKVTTSSLSS